MASRTSTGSQVREEKTCASCGRRIEWRKKWERDWESVRYCSDACRRTKVSDTDRALEAAILDLLARRAAGATICPSEAAKAVGAGPGSASDAASDEAWRALMEPARRAARRLVDAGEVEITQRGHVVDPSTATGPIRIRRAGGRR
ncbi:MAG: DUF2256 and DUF3253 domain-containing protein [Actinomycetota bacterium]